MLHLNNLTSNDFVLVPSEEQARALRAKFALSAEAGGWGELPSITSYSSFATELWNLSFLREVIIGRVQAIAYAKEFLAHGNEITADLIFSTSLARKLVRALERSSQFCVDYGRNDVVFDAEGSLLLDFRNWLYSKLEVKKQILWFDVAPDLAGRTGYFVACLKGRVIVENAEEVYPSLQLLLDSLFNAGIDVEENVSNSPDVESKPVIGLSYETIDLEFTGIAQWVKGKLSGINHGSKVPSLCIALKDASNVDRLCSSLDKYAFTGMLTQFSMGNIGNEPYRISTASSFGCRPETQSILNLFRCMDEDSSIEAMSKLLLCKSFGSWGFDSDFRFKLDLASRDSLPSSISIDHYLSFLEFHSGRLNGVDGKEVLSSEDVNSPEEDIVALLTVIKESWKASPQLDKPSKWAEVFNNIIVRSGWIANHERLGDEWLIDGLAAALGKLEAMDLAVGDIPAGSAISWFREIVDTQASSPKPLYDQPVNIITWDDIKMYPCDELWISGLSANEFPRSETPDPFIPIAIQSSAGYPFSTAEICMQHDEGLINAASQLGISVYASVSILSSTGSSLTPSPLIDKWEPGCLDDNTTQQVTLIHEEDVFPALDKAHSNKISGGVNLFRDHAVASLFSSVRHRLKCKQFPEVTNGISSMVQGILVHAVLEDIWKELGGSDELLSLSEDEQTALIQKAIIKITSDGRVSLDKYGSVVKTLERRRVHALVNDWLEFEKTREQRFRVRSIENKQTLTIESLLFDVRLDRVDEVDVAGSKKRVVIDYKTGANVNMTGLNAYNLIEPQLPLYACGTTDQIDGVTLAQVANGKMTFHMRSNFANSLVKKRLSKWDVDSGQPWEGQVAGWKLSLSTSAIEFANGDTHLPELLTAATKGYEDLYGLYNVDWISFDSVTEAAVHNHHKSLRAS